MERSMLGGIENEILTGETGIGTEIETGNGTGQRGKMVRETDAKTHIGKQFPALQA